MARSLLNAGLVEWEAIETRDDSEIITGTWSGDYRRKADGSFEPEGTGELERLRLAKGPDLENRLDDDEPERYCREPRG